MSIEAWAGKNPIDHTGKLYTFLCAEIAKSVYETTGLPNQVILTSSKEAPVDRPDLVSIGLMGDGKVTEALENAVRKIVWDKLGRVADVTLACIFGDSNPLSRKLLAA
jgi:S-adenosylmethionine synthetase